MVLQSLNPLQSMQKTHPMHPHAKMNKVMNFHYQKVMRKRVLGINPHKKPKLNDMLPDTE